MSLFDVIRYPITVNSYDRFDISSVPLEILLPWYKEDLAGLDSNPTYEYIRTLQIPIYNYHPINKLKRRILEYEPIRYNQIPNRY